MLGRLDHSVRFTVASQETASKEAVWAWHSTASLIASSSAAATTASACAAYLAKAGRSVCVLERRHVLGGCAHDRRTVARLQSLDRRVCRSACSRRASSASCGSPQYGLEILPRSRRRSRRCPMAAASRWAPIAALAEREISKFSGRDADRVPALQRAAGAHRRDARTGAQRDGALIRCRCPSTVAQDRHGQAHSATARSCGSCTGAIKALGADLPEAVEILTGAARPILERWFEARSSKPRSPPTRSSAPSPASARPAVPTCCCIT